jgi:hypothetical protein
MNLSLVYHFRASQNQDNDFLPARYRVVYFFSEKGFLNLSDLRELSKTVPDADHKELTFLSLDDLKAFGLRVAEEYKHPNVRLISVQDYNIGLDGAKDLNSLRGIFEQFGELVENETVRKKGFLSKFFS